MDYVLIEHLIISMGIGALIGAEREREKMEKMNFGGFRTFVLIGLLGSLSSLMLVGFQNAWFFLVVFVGIILLTLATYMYMAKNNSPGIITELMLFVTFILGALSFFEQYKILSIVIAVAVVILVESKLIIHKFIQQTSPAEWTDTLRFASVALIIYPLLPNEFIDPWNLINPSKIWFLVVLISGLEFIGYFMMKIVKSKKAIVLNGFFGGLVSSTATTSSMTNRSKKAPGLSSELALATIVASLTMFIRVLIVVAVLSSSLALKMTPYMLLPILAMGITGLLLTLKKEKNGNGTNNGLSEELGSPFNFIPALKLALMFAVIKIIAQVGLVYFGNSGVYLTTAISGLVDVDAITLSMADMFTSRSIGSTLAIQGILIATIVNTIVKGVIAYTQGEKKFGMKVGLSFGASVIAGIVSIVLLAL